ncbi:uncharacterized protein LOC102354807 isoform X2 [Latimeria chalumnae]
METLTSSIRSTRKRAKTALYITAQQRCEQFPSQLHEDGGKLFCSACNVVLDHYRKSTIIDHLKSKTHMKRQAECAEHSARNQSRRGSSRRCHTVARVEKITVVQDFIKMCMEADIPLEKANHPSVRAFLLDHVKNGGAIPQADQLKKTYLPGVYKTKQMCVNLAGKKVLIVMKMTTDVEQRQVLNILAAAAEKDYTGRVCPFLLDSKFLSSVTHGTVAQAVVKTVIDHGIGFDDVLVFDTDNAPYVRKCYSDVLQVLFPNSVHVICLVHLIIQIVCEFEKPFSLTLTFMKLLRNLFSLGSDVKKRYLQHLREVDPTREPTMPPVPCSTRWSFYLRSATYYCDHLLYLKDFVEKEVNLSGTSYLTLVNLKAALSDEDQLMRLQVELNFLSDKSTKFCDLLDRFQPQIPVATEIVDTLEELQIHLDVNQQINNESYDPYFILTKDCVVPGSLKMEMLEKFKEAFSGAARVLDQYMSSDGQPGYKFLKAVRIFDPTKVPFLSHNVKDYTAVPGWTDIPVDEFGIYVRILVPSYIVNQSFSPKDLDYFWKCASARVPNLAELALTCINSVINSDDEDCSFTVENTTQHDFTFIKPAISEPFIKQEVISEPEVCDNMGKPDFGFVKQEEVYEVVVWDVK